MNFLLHRALAARDLSATVGDIEHAELAGLGAMLPDVWRMADRRLRPRPLERQTADPQLAALLAGIEHHLLVDAWFHRHPAFVDGESFLTERLRPVEGVPRLALFAHIAWELCLDGALLRRDGLAAHLEPLRRALATARRQDLLARSLEAHLSGAARPLGPDALDSVNLETATARVDDLLGTIAEGPWPAGYADPEGVVDRLDGVRRRIRLDPVPPTARPTVVRALDEAIDHAGDRLAELETVETPVAEHPPS